MLPLESESAVKLLQTPSFVHFKRKKQAKRKKHVRQGSVNSWHSKTVSRRTGKNCCRGGCCRWRVESNKILWWGKINIKIVEDSACDKGARGYVAAGYRGVDLPWRTTRGWKLPASAAPTGRIALHVQRDDRLLVFWRLKGFLRAEAESVRAKSALQSVRADEENSATGRQGGTPDWWRKKKR